MASSNETRRVESDLNVLPLSKQMPYAEIVSALRAHSVSINDAHVEAALRDPETGPDLAKWVNTHLTADTLLTIDELELYEALQRSGRAEQLAAAAAESGSRGGPFVTDAELRSATEALDRSTEAIARQTDTLRLQQEAVARLVNTTDQGHRDSRAAFETRHRQQWDASRNDLVAAVEQLCRGLDDRAGDLAQQNKELAQRVQQTVDGLCRSDDTLLKSLQKLGWALPVAISSDGKPDEQDQRQHKSINRLRDICLQLIKLTVETVRTKLDRLYLDALAAASSSGTADCADTTDTTDVAALQDELESLFSEILPVAQMSVEQQYLEPALKALSGKNGRNMTRSLLALDYIDDCLEFLLEHILLLTIRIEAAAAHHAAAESLIAAARAELAVPVPTTTSAAATGRPKRLSNYGSPVRRRLSSSAGVSHMRTLSGGGSAAAKGKGHRRRSSGFEFGSGVAGAPPLEQLLEGLSILLPEDHNGEASSAAANTQALQSILKERSAKADGVASNAQEAFEAASRSYLADARRAVAAVRESVLAESQYGAVQLVDPEIDASIAVMAQEVDRLRRRLAGVNQGVDQARREGSAKRDMMIARWGG